jgi:hypothetical protein
MVDIYARVWCPSCYDVYVHWISKIFLIPPTSHIKEIIEEVYYIFFQIQFKQM